MYDSSLISIDEDRCDCLDANSSCLMLCFCLEANFLERPPTRLSASEACSRVLARQTGPRRPAPNSDGLPPAVQIACCPPRGRGEATAPEAPGSSGKQPRSRVGARLPAEAPSKL